MSNILVRVFDNEDAIEETRDQLEMLRERNRKLSIDLEHAQLTQFSAVRRQAELRLDLERVQAEIRIACEAIADLRKGIVQ